MGPEVQTTALVMGSTVVVAAVTDCWKGKIYNWLTLPVMALAPLWHLYLRGWPGLKFSLEGFGIAALVLVGMALLAGPGLGGGDLKLLAALGALAGARLSLWLLLFTALSGAVVALPIMARRRIIGYTFRNLGMNLASRYAAGRSDLAVGEGSKGGRVPFGLCVMLGTSIALFYPGLRW